ncbi:unnamed protein product [Symbiodinium pilosum]|uniref:Uncharacterized protein n=1 Tax=Symbiodinium pilosum TaxID=2952 RepID=A0A812WR89_SYMPI|nr:unnamed protein product [Symbiodinium pilosum]
MYSPEVSSRTLFCCIPVRLTVLASAVIVTLTSVLYTLDYKLFNQLFRNFVGGFGIGGNIATCLGEYSGLLFGTLGVMGTWSGRRDWVKSYNGWLWFRLLCYGVMYTFDFPLITHCEDFVNSLQPTTEKYGYNPLMYNIAMNSQCSSTRTSFLVLSLLMVFLIMYLIWGTSDYIEFTGRLPKHLLRMPKDLTSGAFYSHSLGERSVLNGMWGKYDHHRVSEYPVSGDPVGV